MAWTPGGRSFLAASEGRLALWDLERGKRLGSLDGHKLLVYAVAVSPDGHFALSCGADTTLRLWDLATCRLMRVFEGLAGQAPAWRADSHFALADPVGRSWWRARGNRPGDGPGCRVVEWSFAGRTVRRPHMREGPIGHPAAVAWSPDGRFALSGGWDEVLRLWDISTGQLRTLTGHKDTVTAVAWSPDGRFALSGGADWTLRLWEVSSGRCLRTVEAHTDMVTVVAWEPDNRHALSAGADGRLRLWELAPKEQRGPLVASRPSPARTDYARLLQQARDALAAAETVRAANLIARARQERGCARRANALDLARQCSRAGGRGAFLGGWARATLWGHSSEVTSVAFSPDGCLALSGGPREAPRLWDVAAGRCLRVFTIFAAGPLSATAVAWSPDGTQALSGGDDRLLRPREAHDRTEGADVRREVVELRRLRLWDIATGRCLRTLEGSWDEVTAVAFGPGGDLALSACRDQRVRLWEVATGRFLRYFRGGLWLFLTSGVGRHQLDPKRDFSLRLVPARLLWRETGIWGCLLLLGLLLCGPTYIGIVHLPTLWAWAPLLVLFAVVLHLFSRGGGSHKDQVTSLAWAPDGRRAVSGGMDRKVRLWDVARGRCLRDFKGHTDTVTAVAWSPDGRFVLSGSGDRTVRLWDAAWGKCLGTFAHRGPVTAVAFSPDSRYFLSGGADRVVRLWDLSTTSGRCVHTFEGHTGWVTSVAFSPDGWLALSGSADRTVRVWQLDWALEGGGLKSATAPCPTERETPE